MKFIMARKSKKKWEFGDFQTPLALAKQAVSVVASDRISPRTIIEPTCGEGSFLFAAAEQIPDAETIIGIDVNPDYISKVKARIDQSKLAAKTTLISADFFSYDWDKLVADLPDPILIIGNPPWVTSSELALLKSQNLPNKSNFEKHRGYDAKTGKSNFDISESMLIKNLECLSNREGMIAVLCKTAVARKILLKAWKRNDTLLSAKILRIDAEKHFGASVDACLFVLRISSRGVSKDCRVYEHLSDKRSANVIGFHDDIVVADVALYQKWRHLKGISKEYVWRSGIKHDCSKVMELERVGEKYRNALGEFVSLEDQYVYPMMKSSDIGNGSNRQKYMLVTQQHTSDNTAQIQTTAPKTWSYLNEHKEEFSRRGSSIYRTSQPFSIFGVGPYSFSPWKVAISGFYNQLSFRVIGPREKKTVVFDDTVYFLPCWSESEARFIGNLLNSEPAQEFYQSMIFWTDKRPITSEVLKRLNLRALALELGLENEYERFIQRRSVSKRSPRQNELELWT